MEEGYSSMSDSITEAIDPSWGRVGLFDCECGCGQSFFAPIKTRRPKYANKTHRARAYRARAKARAHADDFIRSIDCDFATDGQVQQLWLDDFRQDYTYLLSRNRGR
jgi:hypothetical protein